MSLIALLLIVALAIALGAGVGKLPLWPAVVVAVLAELLAHWPAVR